MGTPRLDPSRLRKGEVIAAGSGVLLLVLMVSLHWYGFSTPLGWTAATLGVPTSFTGWDALSHLRWLVVITVASALALAYFQAARRAPAIPARLSVIVTVLALVTFVVLGYRVLIHLPGSGDLHAKPGAYLGLLSALGILCGGFASMRQEGISARDAQREIETVELESAKLGTAGRS
jgi:hypothetical protein